MRLPHRLTTVSLALLVMASGAPGARAQAEPEERHQSEHFTITWVTDPESQHAPDLGDADGDGVPDGITRILESFETVRTLELGLGYREPPVEGRYELYVGGGGISATQPAPGGEGRSLPSYIIVPPGLADPDTTEAELLAWSAHEYFHAIQLGYDSGEDPWISEASSSWIEDLAADAADPNRSTLPWFVGTPQVPLTSTGGLREYGAFLFLQFLTERYGGGAEEGASLVRELWEEMAVPEGFPGAPDRSSVGAIEEILSRHGATPAEAWGEFHLWRWRLGHFEEGETYRSVMERDGWPSPSESSVVRNQTCRVEDGTFGPWSGDYLRLFPHRRGPESARARLTVEAPPGAAAITILKPRTGVAQENVEVVPETGLLTLDLPFGRREVRGLTVGLAYAGREPAAVAHSLVIDGRPSAVTATISGSEAVTHPNRASLSGVVTCGGLPAPFTDLRLTETEVVSGATASFPLETGEQGLWGFGPVPEANTRYEIEVVDPLLSASQPSSWVVGVRVGVVMEIEDRVVSGGEPVVVTGATSPPHPGVAVVVEFRRPERGWRTGPETLTDPAGAFWAEVALPGEGFWEVRARVPETGDEDHQPGISLGRQLVEVRG